MTIMRLQHSFQGSSGLPEDRYVNTFYFSGPGAVEDDAGSIMDAVDNFFEVVHTPSVHPLTWWLGGLADTAAGSSMKIYDMADEKPRPVRAQRALAPASFGAGGTKNLPNELAVCLSYSGVGVALSAGETLGRRRGRLYLGPWTDEALASSTVGFDQMVDQDLIEAILNAALAMAGITNALGWDWAVHSTVGQYATPITTVWVDNAWDIQRRRGVKATGRVTATL